jgi:hypothetical protein
VHIHPFRRDPYSSKPLEGLKVVDVGCGGGILSEVDAASVNHLYELLPSGTFHSKGTIIFYDGISVWFIWQWLQITEMSWWSYASMNFVPLRMSLQNGIISVNYSWLDDWCEFRMYCPDLDQRAE